MVLALGLSQYVIAGLVVGFLLVSLILILTVLIQRPQGGGLSGAFGSGGAGAGQTAFGTRTGDALTTATIAMFVIYLGVAIGLNFALRPAAANPTDETQVDDPNAPPAANGGTAGANGADTDGAGDAGGEPTEGDAPPTDGQAGDETAADPSADPVTDPSTNPAPPEETGEGSGENPDGG